MKEQIQTIKTFMSSTVYPTLDNNTRCGIEHRLSELRGEYTLSLFQNLNRNKANGCYAPHKPVMLLSVMSLIASGHINSPAIILDKDLKDKFKSVWMKNVPMGSSFTCEYRNPFTYMDKDFWSLQADGNRAILSDDVFYALKDIKLRDILSDCLIDMIKNDTIEHSSKVYSINSNTLSSRVAEELFLSLPFVSTVFSMLG